MSYSLHLGDCLEYMKSMSDRSVDAIVTDPPYGLEFMGKEWDHGVPGVRFWTEAIRITKPGTHLLAFGGTRTFHRLACAIEDAGWEIRDCIMWVYGSGFPKSHNLKGEREGWGTALKPAWEPIIVARKPVEGTVAENFSIFGVGAMNIESGRVDTNGESMHGSTPGRWPANLIHDGSDEVLALFPQTTSGERKRTHDNQHTIFGFGGGESYANSGSAARFFYCAKASKQDRDEGLEGMEEGNAYEHDGRKAVNVAVRTDGSVRTETRMRNTHPTVKPTALMRYLCRLVAPPQGLIFDPFVGSGSTGKAATLEGFHFVGCDNEARYVEIAEKRIKAAAAQTVMEFK